MFASLKRRVSVWAIGSALIIATGAGAAQAATTTVYSNTNGGDTFTNPTNGGADLAQAVGASGWYYNNVRYGGTVGINTNQPFDGNGSAWLETLYGPAPVSPGNKTSKADIEYLTGSPLGTLSDLTALSYDWIRLSGGTANNWLHVNLRIFVQDPNNANVKGYLVFERTYNGFGAAPVDAWQFDDVLGSNYKLWATGTLPDAFAKYDRTLSGWQALIGGYQVMSVNAGIGSGWGTYQGAVDDITFGFGGTSTTYNFEASGIVVPEPVSVGLLLGGIGLLALRRRRTA